MKRLKKIFIRTFSILTILYLLISGFLYFQQENLIFFPKKLSSDYKFQFNQKFQEFTIRTKDKINLNGLLFMTESSKGLILYLHGNAGALNSWGGIAKIYTDLNYDVFILDYRGYGKSEGKIYSEKQFHSDIQLAYDTLRSTYLENQIVIIGYSIGTGPAAKLASKNNPKMLILKAPYYSLVDMMHHKYPFLPNILLKYKFRTCNVIEKIKVPITIFHGNKDKVIHYNSSLKLKEFLKSTDKIIILDEQGHEGMNYNQDYKRELMKILAKQE